MIQYAAMARAANLDEYRRSKVTIREIADLAGVSIATVSRVVNGRGDVAPETRELVLRVIQEHGYMTNRSARALSGGRTGHIGLTIPLMRGDYFAAILEGALEAVYEEDMQLVLYTTLHEHDREVSVLERLSDGATDGAIILLPLESSGELVALQESGFPFVVVDPRIRLDDGIPAVSAAHRAGALAATEHLLSLGHRRIGHISGPAGWAATTERIEGYHSALAVAGVLPTSELIVEGNFEAPTGVTAANVLLDLPDPPTAIFSANDNMAAGVLQVAHDRGLKVPGDLSVIGFDDADLATILSPGLTTVRQPLAELGRTGVSLLTRMLEKQRVEALRVELATRLVVRESTGPPRER
jgi:LacI family transcriptional regulator, galactose operon repressor